MDAKRGDAATEKSFEPSSDLIQEQDCDTLILYLSGFEKEQLRVQLARSGILRISGTKMIGDNKMKSFQKDYPVSANCETNNITAKFEGGILYVRQPKLIVPAEKVDEKSPIVETQPNQKLVDEPLPSPPPTQPQKDKEINNTKKSSTIEAQIKKEDAEDFLDKSVPKKDKKSIEEGKVGESEDDKNGKSSTIHDDQLSTTSFTHQHEEFSGKDGIDYYKFGAGGTVTELMKSRKIMSMVVAIILSFALGMCVDNLIWRSKKLDK